MAPPSRSPTTGGCYCSTGATLAALITVAGIWAVAIGVMRVVVAFEVKRLPSYVDEAWSPAPGNWTAPELAAEAKPAAAAQA